ncbi:MAG: general secretion pathway protein GspB [Pseudomonadota bacterium]
MSYILDALKRADAERERGHVPGLHAQPLPGTSAGPAGGPPRWALWAGGGVSLAVVAALAWRMGADAHAPVPVTLTPSWTAPTAEPPVTATPPLLPPAPLANEPVALAPVPPPRLAPATPGPAAANRPQSAAAAGVAPTVRPAAAEPAPAPVAAPVNAPVPLYAQLPPSVRQQMPVLTVSGSVYSDDASARFIMLNGDVAKEGSQPLPGLVVERIEPRSAVLRFKGERFRLPY